MRSWSLRAKESFWFLPSVFAIAAIVLALLLGVIDRALSAGGTTPSILGDAVSADGGRSILSIIGASMLTVAGTAFSITISVLATTSATYGPRLVRNFLADRANQLVLAILTSTFLYTLVVLRSVRVPGDQGGGFVPTLSIHVAVLIGVLDVAVLVFFIHHIADSVQITTLQRRVKVDLERAIERTYPEKTKGDVTREAVPSISHGIVVHSRSNGYVETVDISHLVKLAAHHETVIEVLAMPGVHRVTGEPLVRALEVSDNDAFERSVRAAFSIGTARTPGQDVRFALQQLVEIAVRGLASGSNDPYTAVSALDMAAEALVPLMHRAGAPTASLDERGAVLVITHWPRVEQLLDDVFSSIQSYGLEHPIVIEAALSLERRLSEAAGSPAWPELTTARERLEKASKGLEAAES